MITPSQVNRLDWCGRTQRSATELRDAAIVEAIASGATLREVGDAVGMTHSGVASIVKRHQTDDANEDASHGNAIREDGQWRFGTR